MLWKQSFRKVSSQAEPWTEFEVRRAFQPRPTKVVGQVFNLPKTRENWQVENLPHVEYGLL